MCIRDRFIVVDNSGPAAADNQFADSFMRQLRRPIRLCSRQISRWLITMKSHRAPPVSSHIAKELLAGWCILGSTLQLLQSVWVECPKKRRKLRYVSCAPCVASPTKKNLKSRFSTTGSTSTSVFFTYDVPLFRHNSGVTPCLLYTSPSPRD